MKANSMRLAFCGLLSALLFGCGSVPETLMEYRPWFGDPENGFTKTKSVYDLNFKVQYLPSELLAFNDLDLERPDLSDYDSLASFYDHSSYFLLQFYPSKDAIETRTVDLINGISVDYEDYKQKLNELNFKLDDNIRLISGTDTLEPSLFHFERGYDASPIQRALIAFPKSSDELKHITFIYRDDLFNSGIHKYQFNIHELFVPKIPLTI